MTGVLAVPVEHRAYASATGDHAVVVVDDSTFRIVARVPGPRFPDGIAYAPEERRVFVSDESERRDFVIDAATNSVVARIELDGEAGNTQYDPGSHCVIVAVQTANQLAVIDPATATWCACGRSWSRSSDPMSSATGRRPASYSRRSGRVRRRC